VYFIEHRRALVTGYLHPDYAQSLSEFGTPLKLPRSGGWLIRRPVDGVLEDAMGIYPLLSCSDWSSLRCDLDQVGASLVSAIVVTDPFGDYDESLLRDCFPDLVTRFKSHYANDLSIPLRRVVTEHHARNARIGLQQVSIERCADPYSHLDDWVRLYSVLIERHRISGIRAFSRNSFAKQLKTPGIVAFRAIHERETVGMILWYLQNGVAYYHLGAYTDEGYRLRASFALFRQALDYFAETGMTYANLGAGAGLGSDVDDGLTRFKRGWSTSQRNSYLCGRIFDRQAYDRLVRARVVATSDYFPAYRKGEFN
jgi:Acetyltransferase (GNAT) domain